MAASSRRQLRDEENIVEVFDPSKLNALLPLRFPRGRQLSDRLSKILGAVGLENSASEPIRSIVNVVCSKVGLTVASRDLDYMMADAAASMVSANQIYPLAAKILVLEAIYKEAGATFSMLRHQAALDAMINQEHDDRFTYASACVLRQRYLIRDDDGAIERPQHMFLRVALQMHPNDLVSVRAIYEDMARHKFLPSSPILLYSGRVNPSLSSVYIFPAGTDYREVLDTSRKMGDASSQGGGIGLGVTSIPAKGTSLGKVDKVGIVPTLKHFDSYIPILDEGENFRPSAVTCHLEIWHTEVQSFLNLKKKGGMDRDRARRMYYCLWVNDLFMKRVIANEPWTLFCPTKAPRLLTKFGDDFEEEYRRLELEGKGHHTIRARDLWKAVIESGLKTGGPAIMFKDAVNEKSNQAHIGVISQSGTCMESAQYCDDQETAVCLCASVVLPSYVTVEGDFRFDDLEVVVRRIVRALTRLWGEAHLPFPSARASAFSHRPLGIGLQGLADALAMMSAPFDSGKARYLSCLISETIYFAAVDESSNLARIYGPHPTHGGSPASQGLYQYDHWDDRPTSDRHPWDTTRAKMKAGMANALLTVVMPTSGTSLISGYTEGVEPFPSIARSRTIPDYGYITIFPQRLVDFLEDHGLWDDEMKERIIANQGSIQSIGEIPENIRDQYRTCWEIDSYTPIRMAADRGPFVCQSQSLTLYISPPYINTLSRKLLQAWRAGLKTGMYFIETRPSPTGAHMADEDHGEFLLSETLSPEACEIEDDEDDAFETVPISPENLANMDIPEPFQLD
ncbi:ribonucleotide reductase [Ephemerocybe angulata]|uniref:Ribonucleoside-diphosphate reductase n=1 Tax=Ephemerocybe angulata TaxID=980116 RepID=A0A8H6MGT3_9AGAR|nr:ribonucleotide reductase [Tulosesus angulatus]